MRRCSRAGVSRGRCSFNCTSAMYLTAHACPGRCGAPIISMRPSMASSSRTTSTTLASLCHASSCSPSTLMVPLRAHALALGTCKPYAATDSHCAGPRWADVREARARSQNGETISQHALGILVGMRELLPAIRRGAEAARHRFTREECQRGQAAMIKKRKAAHEPTRHHPPPRCLPRLPARLTKTVLHVLTVGGCRKATELRARPG